MGRRDRLGARDDRPDPADPRLEPRPRGATRGAIASGRGTRIQAPQPTRGDMARLVPNPLGDLERSLSGLNTQLDALSQLPEIRDQLIETNENLVAVRDMLAQLPEALAAAGVPPAETPRPKRRAA